MHKLRSPGRKWDQSPGPGPSPAVPPPHSGRLGGSGRAGYLATGMRLLNAAFVCGFLATAVCQHSRLVALPPMSYLTRWRLLLAGQRLREFADPFYVHGGGSWLPRLHTVNTTKGNLWLAKGVISF